MNAVWQRLSRLRWFAIRQFNHRIARKDERSAGVIRE